MKKSILFILIFISITFSFSKVVFANQLEHKIKALSLQDNRERHAMTYVLSVLKDKYNVSQETSEPTTTQPAPRPEYIPEKFWDSQKGQVNVEEFGKSYVNLEKYVGGKKDELREVIINELSEEAESETLIDNAFSPDLVMSTLISSSKILSNLSN